MENINASIDKIKQLRAEYNLSIPDPIKEDSIADFSKKFNEQFGVAVPDEYIGFLRICDGLVENGKTIYSSFDHQENGVEYGIFENNEVWNEQHTDMEQYVYYGDGDQDLYVFDKETQEYQLLDRYCGDIIEIFPSFAKMLQHVLDLMIG